MVAKCRALWHECGNRSLKFRYRNGENAKESFGFDEEDAG